LDIRSKYYYAIRREKMKAATRILTIAISLSLLLFLLIIPIGKTLHHTCLAQGIAEVKAVEVDIEPEFCPNLLDIESHGALTVAILGTENLDITSIDPRSVRLEEIAPVRYRREDVSTPVMDRQDVCDCTIEGKDGIDDLVLSFDISKIVSILGDATSGDVAVLTITGKLLNGTPIEGEDCVVIQKHYSEKTPARQADLSPASKLVKHTCQIRIIGSPLPCHPMHYMLWQLTHNPLPFGY
jgi:hypothetical protein